MFAIMKNGKFVKDFTEGKNFTTNFTLIERYTDEKSAKIAAQQYGRNNGAGYKVVKI